MTDGAKCVLQRPNNSFSGNKVRIARGERKLLFTVHIPRSQNCMRMQFCEICRRQNVLKTHFVCIAKRVAVNGVNSNRKQAAV